MKKDCYKKVEFYLYNYRNLDNMIKEIRTSIIENVSISSYSHLIGKNTVEEQAIKLADNKKIYKLKKIKQIINDSLKLIKTRNIKRYNFIISKYFNKENPIDIKKKVGYSEKEQRAITDTVVVFFYKQFKKAGIGGI